VLDAGLPVLITGETGSGKEVFARRLHAQSGRRTGPFVAINCAALPEPLIEAELFGYEAGAFTGARRQGMAGRIREAHGGVLFLDEIGDMPLALQARLLRVLEERVVWPLGGGRPVTVDFCLVSATHRDLPRLVEEGRFRADLVYRLNGHGVQLPPLRERADRQQLIADVFAQAGATAKGLSLNRCAREALLAYRWPGNVRELSSVLRALVALAENGQGIDAAALPPALRSAAAQTEKPTGLCAPPAPNSDAGGLDEARAVPEAPHSRTVLSELTRRAIDEALAEAGGNVTQAARRLGLHRSTVHRHLLARRQP
jgi:transcriptional regulator of acetoin/glycerol metabolism